MNCAIGPFIMKVGGSTSYGCVKGTGPPAGMKLRIHFPNLGSEANV